MSSLKSGVTKERGALAGDACLVTAAAFGLVMGALALTFAPEGDPPEDMTWVQLLSALFSLAVVIVGPLVAWRLHGRRLTWMAVLGAVVGGFVLGNVDARRGGACPAGLAGDLGEHRDRRVGRGGARCRRGLHGSLGVAGWTARNPGEESGEAILFAMMVGVGAAMIVTGAEAATSLAVQRKSDTGVTDP